MYPFHIQHMVSRIYNLHMYYHRLDVVLHMYCFHIYVKDNNLFHGALHFDNQIICQRMMPDNYSASNSNKKIQF